MRNSAVNLKVFSLKKNKYLTVTGEQSLARDNRAFVIQRQRCALKIGAFL